MNQSPIIIQGKAEQQISSLLRSCMRTIRKHGYKAPAELYLPATGVKLLPGWRVRLWTDGPIADVVAIGTRKKEKIYKLNIMAGYLLDSLRELANAETERVVQHERERQRRRKQTPTI